ncbi:MAG: DEAD/DEAH box helicase [Bdellovibrionota bacterium]
MRHSRRNKNTGPLSGRIGDRFAHQIRDRGMRYYQEGMVGSPTFGPELVTVSVRGSERYSVRVDWSRVDRNNEILIDCSCPHYEGGSFCKHCWAVVLYLEDEGIADEIPGNNRLKVTHLMAHAPREKKQNSGRRDRDRNRRRDRSLRELEPSEHDKPVERDADGRPIQPMAGRGSPVLPRGPGDRPGDAPRVAPAQPSGPALPRTAYFILDLIASRARGEAVIQFHHQNILPDGRLGPIQPASVSRSDLALYTNPVDRELLGMLLAGTGAMTTYATSHLAQTNAAVPSSLNEVLLSRLAQSGRFFCSPRGGGHFHLGTDAVPFRFDDGEPYRLVASVTKRGPNYHLEGFLERGTERLPLSEPALCLRAGIVFFRDRVARLHAREYFDWIATLRDQKFPPVPESAGDQLVEMLTANPSCPPIDWPPELRWREERPEPVASVVFTTVPGELAPELHAELRFSYDGAFISFKEGGSLVLDRMNRRMIPRNLVAERAAYDRLAVLLGVRCSLGMPAGPASFRVKPSHFSSAVSEIISWGWTVTSQGKPVRSAGAFDIKVSTNVDWFALDARVPWAEALSSSLPDLLAAQARGEQLITLGDGSLGVLPTEWLRKIAPLAQLGSTAGDTVRFAKPQGALLGAWLSTEENGTADPAFKKLVKELGRFGSLEPLSPTKTFKGSLRPYQKEGLAWLDFLRDLGQGGILADDMGLGKTVQVLAHLESVYTAKKDAPKKPSIVVLPKSLLFNWQEESAKFTPKLKVLAYAGQSRSKLREEIAGAHLVLVTYPTLRLDLEELLKFDFHYVIADEAQAIKNAGSLSHKACCQLKGPHRLAMSGTPVENSIDDLFALMDFVSPGLLGKNAREKMSRAAAHGKLDTVALEQLANALRPFILRRTKGQVLKDLPEKIEKVLHCELSTIERKRYVELRDYYREHLRGAIEAKGIAKSKILILEALLRLRQAACHPGLMDKKRIGEESSKTDTLLAQLSAVVAEGHKALVFSQFTTFLDIVEGKLAEQKISCTRLDGSVSSDDRRDRVTAFQNDPSLKVFLVSLKAGGVGLNLTAADYVFILDPWWNPAAESQAIDRTHRIGQKNSVIAYRLIAKDTVEEKIVELQSAKRDLAAAILSADANLIKGLTAGDVEILLS